MRALHFLYGVVLASVMGTMALAQTTAGANAGASVTASATAPRFHNGYWWYQNPTSNQWSYWRNNQWNAYVAANAAANVRAAVNPNYRFHNGSWWYMNPNTNQWSYWRNNQWNAYAGANLGARIGGNIAGNTGANLGANLGAAVTGQPRYQNGYWWNQSGQVWNGRNWTNYTPGLRISGYGNYGANGRVNTPYYNGNGRANGNYGGNYRAPSVSRTVRGLIGGRF